MKEKSKWNLKFGVVTAVGVISAFLTFFSWGYIFCVLFALAGLVVLYRQRKKAEEAEAQSGNQWQ